MISLRRTDALATHENDARMNPDPIATVDAASSSTRLGLLPPIFNTIQS